MVQTPKHQASAGRVVWDHLTKYYQLTKHDIVPRWTFSRNLQLNRNHRPKKIVVSNLAEQLLLVVYCILSTLMSYKLNYKVNMCKGYVLVTLTIPDPHCNHIYYDWIGRTPIYHHIGIPDIIWYPIAGEDPFEGMIQDCLQRFLTQKRPWLWMWQTWGGWRKLLPKHTLGCLKNMSKVWSKLLFKWMTCICMYLYSLDLWKWTSMSW